ncbi:MAG: N-acetylglucosamine-6-phosphate deacetylase [Pararhodobacter sp.]|nr:N-acetylglucosamine-6-phosphate deacetylase [Pararhodobacter sp.]
MAAQGDTVYRAEWLHDGTYEHEGAALWVQGDRLRGVLPADAPLPEGARLVDLGAGGIAPGFVDLQVNGGGGAMLGEGVTGEAMIGKGRADAAAIARLCATHAALGATSILPTLISDRPATTEAVIKAAIAAHRTGAPGLAGLHLEGPHLDRRRAGAHDPALLRVMSDDDLALYLRAARELPALMITLAPEAASLDQIAALARAGAVVALGHSNCDEATARAAQAAGARAVTHLYNAMSGFSHRAPGLTGAALDCDDLACGLISDGWHAADAALRLALRAKPAGRLFLVSDAMAPAGTDMVQFSLGGRVIHRKAGKNGRPGRLTLEDGTLAGADLSLPQAVAHLHRAGASRARAIAMATSVPAALIGAPSGRLEPGARADFLHLAPDLALREVWQGGRALA